MNSGDVLQQTPIEVMDIISANETPTVAEVVAEAIDPFILSVGGLGRTQDGSSDWGEDAD